MSASPVLQIRDLSVRLPAGADRALAVSNVNLEVERGEVLCLVGESGSGKSVLAQTVMGLLPNDVQPAAAGSILLNGEDLLRATPARRRQLRGEQMAMIFQEPMTALNPVMRCGAQLDELLRQHTNANRNERRKRILDIFARVRLPDIERMADAYPHQLSGGQRQRIMIAMALILRPALLIADEPTTALDVTTQAEILQLMRELMRDHATAVMFITHDFGVVAEIADRVAVLRYGEVVEYGSVNHILTSPTHAYSKLLLASVPSLTPPQRHAQQAAADVLQVQKLSKTYHSTTWLQPRRHVNAALDIDLTLRRGETVGVVGESGSGKSTLARCVARLIEPSAGDMLLHGQSVLRLDRKSNRNFRRRVQMVFQDPFRSLNPRRSVGRAITEGPRNFGASRAAAWQRAEELMRLVHLPTHALHRFPHQFSGGQRQRIAIARALACDPELLIADEPVSALDVSVQAQILGLLQEIQAQLKLAMLFITHDLRVAAQVCDRIVVMQHGKVVEQGATADVFRAPRHPYTQALLAAAPGRQIDFGKFAPRA